MTTARVYVGQYRSYPALENDLFSPLYCGQNKDDFPVEALRSDTGEHIADTHRHWDELTGLYWIWKNTRHDIVGWMQEQRYLSLSGRADRDSAITGFSAQSIHENGWSSAHLVRLMERYALVIPQAYRIDKVTVASDIGSPLDFYLREGGSRDDIDALLEIIRVTYPDYFIHALEVIHGSHFIPWHLFVMRRDIFEDYAGFLFPILFDLDRKRTLSGEKSFQRTIWGVMAELLFNVYVYHIMQQQCDLPILRGAIVHISNNDYSFDRKAILQRILAREKTVQTIMPKEVHFGGKVNVVLSFDAGYSQHACALINSILAHTANGKDFSFYILHDEGLDKATIRKIERRYRGKAAFFFLPVMKKSFVHRFPMNRRHINVNTYYRLLIQDVLPPQVTRVIYLDTDIIVCDDLVDLWNTDMQSCSIAGVLDEPGMSENYRLFDCEKNCNYINAGVIILDFERARQRYGRLDFQYASAFYNYADRITMQDQDILNIAYRNDVFTLPLRWNVGSSAYYCGTSHSDARLDGMEHNYTREALREACQDPAILHFFGSRKPWRIRCPHPLKALYWHYCRLGKASARTWRERLICWNHYVHIRNGMLHVTWGGREYAWHLHGRLMHWRGKRL